MTMATKRKRTSRHQNNGVPVASPHKTFDSPFKGLKKLLTDRELPPKPAVKLKAPAPVSAEVAPSPADDDLQLLRQALSGVRPLAGPRHAPPPQEPLPSRTIRSEEVEVLAELSDLVAGQREFDITETEEYVEGSRTSIDPRMVVRLRRGEFAVEAHLDMHGLTQVEARETLGLFVQESVRKGRRTVLLVHGRGLGSPGGEPVLKRAVVQWLSHGWLSGHVLAFVTARPTDGGAGALYVLLQRLRRRAPFEVLNGTKRRD